MAMPSNRHRQWLTQRWKRNKPHTLVFKVTAISIKTEPRILRYLNPYSLRKFKSRTDNSTCQVSSQAAYSHYSVLELSPIFSVSVGPLENSHQSEIPKVKVVNIRFLIFLWLARVFLKKNYFIHIIFPTSIYLEQIKNFNKV